MTLSTAKEAETALSNLERYSKTIVITTRIAEKGHVEVRTCSKLKPTILGESPKRYR